MKVTFSTKFVTDALQFMLDNNTFYFKDIHSHQTKGWLCNGVKSKSCVYNHRGCLLEELLFIKVEYQFNRDIRSIWKRYIDDCIFNNIEIQGPKTDKTWDQFHRAFVRVKLFVRRSHEHFNCFSKCSFVRIAKRT